MSKIVCDVCGSTFSDTEAQCPICGTAKSDNGKSHVETNKEEQPKAGKYSQNTTKKSTASAKRSNGQSGSGRKQEKNSNLAMIIIVAVLVVAIIAVGIVIALTGNDDDPYVDNTRDTTSTAKKEPVACTGFELIGVEGNALSFTELTESKTLELVASPSNTTETLTYHFESSDEAVVRVDENGKVTPVGTGSATITITCDDHDFEAIVVNVTCTIAGSDAKLELKDSDITLSDTNGSISHDLYKLIDNAEQFDKDKFTITVDREDLISVDGTVVTVIKDNDSTVTVKATITYGEQSVEYKFRVGKVSLAAHDYELRSDWGSVGTASDWLVFNMSLSDKDDAAPNKIVLKLVDKDGNVVKDFELANSNDFPKCCTVVKNAETGEITVTAIATTETLTNGQFVFLYVNYSGIKYTCKITVSSATE